MGLRIRLSAILVFSGNGDDGLASWSSIADGTESAVAENNKFLHNTIELGWRAGGVGIFGGKGHEIAYNRIKDNIGMPEFA